ncbi:PREDICTED: F-box/FBD/LRR-repeat protein At1g51370-like [Camelina sativa]|uniref:F-box/FBD/LRR-repeat protein At1g51370-like n=1 Tax=Camelina sativa TaxID=90675 RepID=A0ABM1RGS4_CAMSA|nr:PREDICTED: F-box/FBD/LRR-repeat protein At1g51370-like [Camelina sativa]
MRRKKKSKICDKASHEEEDRIGQLPEPLISEILYHLTTKDAVRTSVLSTKWRNLWRWVPGLVLNSRAFSDSNALVSFLETFFYYNRESWIRKLRLSVAYCHGICGPGPTSLIDAVITRRRIQHLDLTFWTGNGIPLSLYTCETLVHLRLYMVTLCNAEFVSLPCLKIMHLQFNKYPNETTLQKLISGSPVLEDLTIYRDPSDKAFRVHSYTLKRIHINASTEVVIDAPLLHCLSAKVYPTKKNFQIVNLGFSTRIEIDLVPYPNFSHVTTCSRSMIHDILTDISRVRDLVIINNALWKEIFQYSKSGPVLQFPDLSRLNVKFSKSDIEMLPTILESCPKLESLLMVIKIEVSRPNKKKIDPKVIFSTVPRCLVSSLKFVGWKRSILGLEIYYTGEKPKCAFLEELVTMPRCSSVCEIHFSVMIPKK